MREHLITTQAKGVTCPRCRRPVLAGIAEGLNATVDLIAINPAEEIDALLSNRRTYTLIAGELVYREPVRIRGQLRGVILAEHKCVSRKTIQDSLFDVNALEEPSR
jgi:hypothetical protein